MPDLSAFKDLVAQDHGLAVVVTVRPDGTPQSSLVTAGVLAHPRTGAEVVAFVAAGNARKLRFLRANPATNVVLRAGWRWAAVEGTAELIGPDDAYPDADAEAVRVLLRDIFTAAGGTHGDWDEYDRVMHDERRAAVLVTPTRTYGTPG